MQRMMQSQGSKKKFIQTLLGVSKAFIEHSFVIFSNRGHFVIWLQLNGRSVALWTSFFSSVGFTSLVKIMVSGWCNGQLSMADAVSHLDVCSAAFSPSLRCYGEFLSC